MLNKNLNFSLIKKQKNAKSLFAFMNKIIDYAGLFPPAKLPLEIAFANYIDYKKSDFNYMLSGFVCPVNLLSNLKSLIQKNNTEDVSLSLLATQGKVADEFKKNIDNDVRLWNEFLNEAKVKTGVIEIRIPDATFNGGTDSVVALIDYAKNAVTSKIPNEVFIFFEGTNAGDGKASAKILIESVTLNNLQKNNCGFKLRTGGIEASAFPAEELISYSIKTCIDRDITMKCTAGLHHPVTHFNQSVNARMYGFLNVFGAGIIGKRHNLSEFEMNKILTDENPDNFVFTEQSFLWNDYEILIEDIIFARQSLMNSFGSCSFDEPVGDLKAMNLL